MQENPKYFGKLGFHRPQKLLDDVVAINVGDLDEAADRLVAQGIATQKGKKYTIDVSRLGVDKILGSGKVTRKLNLVSVKAITARAREKILANGGSVDLPIEE
jgi:large subunit ribosomal protein L15